MVATTLRQTLGWGDAGLLIGGIGGLAGTRVLRACVDAVEPRDPGPLVSAARLLATIGPLVAFARALEGCARGPC